MNNQQPIQRRKDSFRNTVYLTIAFSFLFMLAIIGYLANNSFQLSKKIVQANVEYNNVHATYDELETQFEAALEELDYYVGVSGELNTLIEMQKEELKARRNDIAKLIYHGSQLEFARIQIRGLKEIARLFLVQIGQLKDVNTILLSTNKTLKNQKEDLFVQLSNQQMVNEQLTESKAVLVNHRAHMNRAIEIGSVIKVNNIEVKGLKVRPNGKAKKRKSSRKVDELQICITTTANEVVDSGPENFLVRIVNPRGETLANEALGDSYITLKESGETIPVTSGAEIQYQNKERDICWFWSPNLAFIPGNYKVEVYNKGYLAGAGKFKLR